MPTTYNYWCPRRSKNPDCKFCSPKGDIVTDEQSDDFICPSSEEEIPLKLLGQNSLTVVSVYKVSKEAIKAERSLRRKTHFEKETMPYLPKEEQRGFMSKGYRNK